MALKLGLHTGQQDCSYGELRNLWRIADNSGFYWISVWDHHFESPPVDSQHPSFETVSIMSALALETSNVRVGCLVFSPAYRNPGLLAKAVTTVDHLSNGRAEIGFGAGWHEPEYKAFGIDFPRAGIRENQLEETVQIARMMFRDGVANFDGEFFTMKDAYNRPRPIQENIRIWIGGGGEKRTIPAAAKYADAWNGAYFGPDVFRNKLEILGKACEQIDRDPTSIDNAVNVGFYMGLDAKQAKAKKDKLPWGPSDPRYFGQLTGTPDEAMEKIGAYVKAGAQQLNLAMRAPFDLEALQAFVEQVMPAFNH